MVFPQRNFDFFKRNGLYLFKCILGPMARFGRAAGLLMMALIFCLHFCPFNGLLDFFVQGLSFRVDCWWFIIRVFLLFMVVTAREEKSVILT